MTEKIWLVNKWASLKKLKRALEKAGFKEGVDFGETTLEYKGVPTIAEKIDSIKPQWQIDSEWLVERNKRDSIKPKEELSDYGKAVLAAANHDGDEEFAERLEAERRRWGVDRESVDRRIQERRKDFIAGCITLLILVGLMVVAGFFLLRGGN